MCAASPKARLRSLSTAAPQHVLRQDAVTALAGRLFEAADPDLIHRMLPVYENAGIQTRYSCVPPDWYQHRHGWADKNALYLDHAVTLLARAAADAIAAAGLASRDIDAIIAVSTTGIAVPSLDARLIDRLGLRRDVERLPIFGLGCAGGVMGLARAAARVRAGDVANVLLVVVELCGLTFRRADHSKSNIIATALFGDGAAAAVVSSGGDGPAVAHWGEHTWPDTLDIMGWSVEDDGLGVMFSRDIPALTRTAFRDVLHDYLDRHGLRVGDIDHFVCHPGGAKVLDALEEVFGVAAGGLDRSRAVLNDYGNMSAATVLFVLRRVLDDGGRGRLLLSTLGPGFTAAFLTLEAA
jgi:alkylresorcinol/alkylpyrone synthase